MVSSGTRISRKQAFKKSEAKLLSTFHGTPSNSCWKKSSYLVLCPPLILHHWLRINLHILSLSFLLLDQRGAGHAEDAVDVHSHFDLHFRAVSIWLGNHALDRKTSW